MNDCRNRIYSPYTMPLKYTGMNLVSRPSLLKHPYSFVYLDLCSPVLKVITCIFSVQQVNLQELIQTDLVDGILLTAVTHTDQEIQAEGWRTCSVITKNYYAQTMPALWKKLMTATQDQLPITAESLKFVESYANAMEEHQHYDEGWWKIMIESYLHKASSDDSPHVRVAACDCFASIPKEVFEKFHVSFYWLEVYHQHSLMCLCSTAIID